MTKSELRQLYMEKRRSLPATRIASMSAAIAERFFSEIDLSGVGNLHIFIRIRKFNEMDTSAIYFRVWRDRPFIRTFAPRLNFETGELDSVEFNDSTELAENTWGIPEPEGDERVDPQEIDLVIVPLLCFDEAGYRVGYGKGYYDKLLLRCRPDCQLVGVSLFPPVDSVADLHEKDVPLHLCITPDTVYRPALPN